MQGILFKEMLTLANLRGDKTRTSRTRGLQKLNENPNDWELDNEFMDINSCYPNLGLFMFKNIKDGQQQLFKFPYGKVGDTLYGKETYHVLKAGGKDGSGREIEYKATNPDFPYGWQSPMMMPEWASRYHLIIGGIGIQRINEITEEDCIREGVTVIGRTELNELSKGKFKHAFGRLWDSINHNWNDNVWSWYLYYKVVKK